VPILDIDESPDVYTGSVAVVNRTWATANRQQVVAYLRAYTRAITWLYDPANHEAAASLLVSDLALTPDRARQIHDDALGRRKWLVPDGAVSPAGMREVALQTLGAEAMGSFRFEDYVDLSMLAEARKARNR
jgi:ABC-type nitrate/sulfonate/bicarbonate transport system substrate-binding protein